MNKVKDTKIVKPNLSIKRSSIHYSLPNKLPNIKDNSSPVLSKNFFNAEKKFGEVFEKVKDQDKKLVIKTQDYQDKNVLELKIHNYKVPCESQDASKDPFNNFKIHSSQSLKELSISTNEPINVFNQNLDKKFGCELEIKSFYDSEDSFYRNSNDFPINTQKFHRKQIRSLQNNFKGDYLIESNNFSELLDKLQKENSNLKLTICSLNTKITQLKVIIDLFNQEKAEYMKNYQEKLKTSEIECKDIKNELKIKKLESEKFQNQIRLAESQKFRFSEISKQLETELDTTKKVNTRLESKIYDLDLKCQQLRQQLECENSKTSNYDDLSCKLIEKENEISDLIKNLNSLRTSNESLNQKYSALRSSFDDYVVESNKKQDSLKNSIQDLVSQVSSLQHETQAKKSRSSKLKRASQLEESEVMRSYKTNKSNRNSLKITDLEKENVCLQAEISKLIKNEDYYKDLLKSKNHIVAQLEEKIASLGRDFRESH
jgi:chromosome segregation ATPase